MKGNGQS